MHATLMIVNIAASWTDSPGWGGIARILPRRRSALAAVAALLILLAPLPLGGVAPWALLSIRLVSFLCLIVAAGVDGFGGAARRVRWPLVALCALALLAGLQSLSLPAGIVGLLSPRHLELARSPGGAELSRVSLSLAPELSRSAALSLAAAASLLVAGAVCGGRPRTRLTVVGAVLVGGVVQATHGLREWAIGGAPRLRGSFFNPDHCALYLELSLVLATAVVWWCLRNRKRLSLEVLVLSVGASSGLWLGLLAALALTGSRAAMVAAAVGGTVQGALILGWLGRRWRRYWPALLGAGMVPLAVVLLVQNDPILDRLMIIDLADSNIDLRMRIWSDSLRLVGMFPLTGAGLGSFLEAFSLVQDAGTVGLRWVRAHNDYVELLASAGLAGAAALSLGLIGIVGRLRRLGAASSGSRHRAVVLAGWGLLAVAATHELFDFGATLPGNWVALSTLMGALLGTRRGSARPLPVRDVARSRGSAPGGERPGSRQDAGRSDRW